MRNWVKIVFSLTISCAYHFPYLVDVLVSNVYLLKKDHPWVGNILDFYLTLHESMFGMLMYFHLALIAMTVEDDRLKLLWVGLSVLIVTALSYFFISFLASAYSKRKPD